MVLMMMAMMLLWMRSHSKKRYLRRLPQDPVSPADLVVSWSTAAVCLLGAVLWPCSTLVQSSLWTARQSEWERACRL
jgi:hypothetical protein